MSLVQERSSWTTHDGRRPPTRDDMRGTEQLAFSYSTLKALSAIEAKLKLDDDALVRDKANATN